MISSADGRDFVGAGQRGSKDPWAWLRQLDGTRSQVALEQLPAPRLQRAIAYLHTNPLDGLNVGERVDRGQLIAHEAARGASSAHTHVEMRPVRRELAAVSVGDSTLSNPIPTTFWMNRGYNICCQ